MPPCKIHQKLKLARETLAEKRGFMATEISVDDVKKQLFEAIQQTHQLENLLAEKEIKYNALRAELQRSDDLVNKLREEVGLWRAKHKEIYHSLHMQRQATKRGLSKQGLLEAQIDILKEADAKLSAQLSQGSQDSKIAIDSLLKVNEHLQSELSQSISTWTSRLEFIKSKLQMSDTKLKGAQKDVSRLHKVCCRATGVKEHAIEKTKTKVSQQKSVHYLMKKGVFTEQTRNLVHLLAKAGCSGNYINEVIVAVLQSAGIETVGHMPSVTQIIREGFFAAQIQLGHEMKIAQSMTFSADGTGHQSINYNSRQAHLLVEDYKSQENNDKLQCATRFLGIRSARDGSSDEAIADWQLTLSDIVDLYNHSPFGKRSGGGLLRVIDILIKLTGMNTDHCAKERKMHKRWRN